MSIELKSWSVTDYLDSPETIASFLDAVLEADADLLFDPLQLTEIVKSLRTVGLPLRVETMDD